MRGGNRFHIRPCVWIFAGSSKTEKVKVEGKEEDERVDKFDDFRSRLSDGEIQLSGSPPEEALERLERVYVAVSFMRERFPDLRRVSAGVLFAFYRIDPSIEVRRIRHLVHKVQNVQENEMLMRNVSFIEREDGLGDLLALRNFEAVSGKNIHCHTSLLIRDR